MRNIDRDVGRIQRSLEELKESDGEDLEVAFVAIVLAASGSRDTDRLPPGGVQPKLEAIVPVKNEAGEQDKGFFFKGACRRCGRHGECGKQI